MPFVRRALATAAFAALAVTPGATAFASSDTPDLVRGLATDGAHLVAEESELLDASSNPSLSVTELAEARSTLRTVDAQATAIMQQLDLLGVDLSNAIRAATSQWLLGESRPLMPLVEQALTMLMKAFDDIR